MKQNRMWIPVLAALVVITALAHAQGPSVDIAAPSPAHTALVPSEVKWGSCPPSVPPGAECSVIEGDLATPGALFAFRLKMPDGYSVPPHFHPGDEHVIVISGTFSVGFGKKADRATTHAMPAGSFMIMPKDAPHFAWATGETILHIYAVGPWGISYVNPEDDPRN